VRGLLDWNNTHTIQTRGGVHKVKLTDVLKLGQIEQAMFRYLDVNSTNTSLIIV